MGRMISPEVLRRYPIFASFDDVVLRQLATLAGTVQMRAGEGIFEEGDKADYFYLILEGQVELSLSHGRAAVGQVAVTRLGGGEVFGWSSIVEPYRYQLSAEASKPTRLARFDGVALCEAMTHNPAMGHKLISRIAQVIGGRLMDLRVQLVSLIEGERLQELAGRGSLYVSEGGRATPYE
jgi:CRP-like cAMP-binding protein